MPDLPTIGEPGGALPRGKLIDLQGHQAAEQLLDDLLRADRRSPSYHTLVARAVNLGPPVLTSALRRVDSSRPTRLSVIGRLVATYPARAEAVKAFARAAADRRNSDNRRFGALLVLSQYLGVPPVEDFLSSLRNPAAVLAWSFVGTLTEAGSDVEALHEFASSLLGQSVEVLYAVMHALQDIPGEGAVGALRVLAMQPEPELMQGAVEALASRPHVSAARALAMVEPNLPPDTARTVGRLLQKLRLSGYEGDLLFKPPADSRARLGPVDGHGTRALWISPGASVGDPLALGLSLNDKLGVLSCAVSHVELQSAEPAGASPLRRSQQARAGLHRVQPRILTGSTLLDVPFIYGLEVLRESVQRNWDSGTPVPLDYQLFLHAIWRYGAGLSTDGDALSDLPESDPGLFDSESELLSDPLFESWYLETGAVHLAAQELVAQDIGLPEELTDESWRALLPVVIKLARGEFTSDVRERYSRRLRQMSAWLLLGGRDDESSLAASAARTMLYSPPEANLFALKLVQKGILVAVDNILSGRKAGG